MFETVELSAIFTNICKLAQLNSTFLSFTSDHSFFIDEIFYQTEDINLDIGG